MKTQDARWMRIRDLFERAVEIPADQRSGFIDRHCGGDAELREELQALLASDDADSDSERSRGVLTGAIGAAVDATTRSRREELLDSTIGAYRLTSILGHGGAGTVYLGERIDRQYSAQVAIKVVEGATLNAEIGRRFRAERQILASLNHPYIARLIDAGESRDGYPYLVMEYVHGEPIDKYCDRLRLGVEQRVELLIKVCSAVQYAHQNLVVHRDLKPGNILVTPDGTPKLLDFGIAKLLDTADAAAALALTRMNDRVLTPEYASPEQILGQTVTTSSDVYSLGVVLFELLTGLRPYKVSSASQLELERTICVVDPARASTVIRQALSSAAIDPPPSRNIHSISEARQITPMRLRARLNGDLDSILMRALRKETLYRYSSIEQFANDLRRHLAREPVLARQGNWVYYAQRFARRHALGVSVTAGFIAMLSAALVVMSVQNKQITEQRDAANREKQTSEAVANFMANVFASADPFTVQDRQVSAKDLLDNATQNIQNNLNQEPAVKARLLEAIGRSYSRQGFPDRAVSLIRDALTIRLKVESANSPAIASTWLNLGKAQRTSNDTTAARASLEAARNLLSARPKSNEFADVLVELGRIELQSGNPGRARALFAQAIPLLRELRGSKDSEVGAALISLAHAMQWQNDYSAVQVAAREAVDIYKATMPALHPDRLTAESLLADALFSAGQIEEAAQIYERIYVDKLKVFGITSTNIVPDLQALVKLRIAQHRYNEAEGYARIFLNIYLARAGNDNNLTAYARTSLAAVLWKREQFKDAEGELRSALSVYRQTLPDDHPYIISAEYYLAECLLGLNKVADAIAQLRATLSRLHAPNASANTPKTTEWRAARVENALGQALYAAGQAAEAQTNLENSYRVLSTSSGVDRDALEIAYARIERFYAARGDNKRLAKLRERPIAKPMLVENR